MKINKSNLKKALEIVKPGLANKEMIEQTTSFAFVNGRVVTYNDEISISHPVPDLELTGAVASTELFGFVSKAKKEEIILELTDNEILLKSGRAKAHLTLQSEILLPLNEDIAEVGKWKKFPKDILKAIKFSIGGCSADMSRPVLTCVHVAGSVVESSDGYSITSSATSKSPIKAFLLPASSCVHVLKIAPTHIAEGDGWIHFKNSEETLISCRIFDDEYVNTTPYLDFEGEELHLPTSMLEILERAQIFSNRQHMMDEVVTISIEKGFMTIQSSNAAGGFEEKARIDYEGEKINFNITPYLLQDILKETTICTLNKNRLQFEEDNWKYITILREG